MMCSRARRADAALKRTRTPLVFHARTAAAIAPSNSGVAEW
jgi:hypothetical protein